MLVHLSGLYLYSITQEGDTALIWAALNGKIDCVRLLVEAASDKEAKDNVRGTTRFLSLE